MVQANNIIENPYYQLYIPVMCVCVCVCVCACVHVCVCNRDRQKGLGKHDWPSFVVNIVPADSLAQLYVRPSIDINETVKSLT